MTRADVRSRPLKPCQRIMDLIRAVHCCHWQMDDLPNNCKALIPAAEEPFFFHFSYTDVHRVINVRHERSVGELKWQVGDSISIGRN